VSADPVAVRFSIVIPAHNEADYLGATLESLQQQSFTGRYEVIVVDDGSSDQTAEIARSHGVHVVGELRLGVCAARQRGTEAARGEIVVSTDADTVHPTDWLTRLDAQFRTGPVGVVAVAGPCWYQNPPWWAAIVPRVWFAAIAAAYARFGVVGYITATNVAFVRSSFPGYNTTLAQGGDEVDLLRRLRRCGRVVWDADNPVLTSSRRMDQGLAHTLVVSYGYYYALSHTLNRLASRTVIGAAPPIRRAHQTQVRLRRRRWRIGVLTAAALVGLRRTRSRSRGR